MLQAPGDPAGPGAAQGALLHGGRRGARVKGLLARFTIRSPYGDASRPHGIHMLPIRVNEVEAHRQARRAQQDEGVRRGGGQGDRAPGHLHRQHARPPGGDDHGLPRRRGAALRTHRARIASESYQAATAPDQSGRPAGRGSLRSAWAWPRITALGFEKERRDLAKSLGVDPYTTNPVLSEKLTKRGLGGLLGPLHRSRRPRRSWCRTPWPCRP